MRSDFGQSFDWDKLLLQALLSQDMFLAGRRFRKRVLHLDAAMALTVQVLRLHDRATRSPCHGCTRRILAFWAGNWYNCRSSA